MTSPPSSLQHTPLHGLHVVLGAKMAPFAGYDMPLHYAAGILGEHKHTRASASLFDVSHMGQARLYGDEAAAALERLVPGDIQALAKGRMRYSLLTSAAGGILDDLMITRMEDHFYVVYNAARKDVDERHITAHLLPAGCTLEVMADQALIALQGPAAAAALGRHAPGAPALSFLSAAYMAVAGAPAIVSRSGYTGEDGYEISLPAAMAQDVARALLGEPEVAAAGLGARDSLRLEAGLCLYGADIDETTSPIEAGLAWTIGKRRKIEGGFLGAEPIMAQLFDGPPRRRVGILPDGRAPARAHTPILDADGAPVGEVTSGGFSPTLGRPIAMGYVATDFATDGAPVGLEIRGRVRPGHIAPMPFVPHHYKR